MKWVNKCLVTFHNNFAHIGVSAEEDQEAAYFYQESPYCFIFYASGRQNIKFCKIHFQVDKQKLHIIIYSLHSSFIDKI